MERRTNIVDKKKVDKEWKSNHMNGVTHIQQLLYMLTAAVVFDNKREALTILAELKEVMKSEQ